MNVPRAFELIRNWALLVDHDIPNDHMAHLAVFMSEESEKEKDALLKEFNEQVLARIGEFESLKSETPS